MYIVIVTYIISFIKYLNIRSYLSIYLSTFLCQKWKWVVITRCYRLYSMLLNVDALGAVNRLFGKVLG